MDRKTDRGKAVDDKEGNSELEAILQELDSHKLRLDASLDESMKSFWVRYNSRRKLELQLLKNQFAVFTDHEKRIVSIAFSIASLEKRLFNVEKIVQSLVEKTDANLSDIKSEISSLRKQTIPKPIQQYINEFRQDWEDRNKLIRKWFK